MLVTAASSAVPLGKEAPGLRGVLQVLTRDDAVNAFGPDDDGRAHCAFCHQACGVDGTALGPDGRDVVPSILPDVLCGLGVPQVAGAHDPDERPALENWKVVHALSRCE